VDQNKKDPKRLFFWELIGSMLFVTVSAIPLAFLKAGELPDISKIKKDFSIVRLFPSLKATAALAQSSMLKTKSAPSENNTVISHALPEFESGDIVLDEVLPDEDPLDSRLLSVLSSNDIEASFNKPLAARAPLILVDLSDISRQKIDDVNVIEKLVGEESEIVAEDNDEKPWLEYAVKQGDHMSDISAKYGIPVATICKANNITNPNRLTLGQILLIPRSVDLLEDVLEEQKARAEEKSAAKLIANPVNFIEYNVKRGDTLWKIASDHKLSIDSLYGTNIMRNPDRLSPGTKLRIPNQDGLCVKIAKGQSIASLSKKYSVSEKAIRIANRLSVKKEPKIGEEIFIPGASKSITIYRGSAGSGGVSKVAPLVANNPREAASMHFGWPVNGGISSPFGWRKHPINKTRKFHTGIDIRAKRNTPIRAAKAGQVIYAGWMSGYGRTVIIRHDSAYTTLYAHAQTLKVRKGMYVRKGTIIATVGSSGRATGPHTHFEIRRNDKPANPLRYLR
jgi:murein DD-endopeptidase MepM/ murein hydrolase activator NlpD